MAQRRMFSIKIIDSAKFLKMPSSSRLLYYDLGMRADDDGIVEAFNTLRMTGATEDDLRILISKGFVDVLNDDLVTYICDWNEHNRIRADRKVDSIYKDLLLQIKPEVQLLEPRKRADLKQGDDQWTSNGQPKVGIGKVRLGKDRLGKVSINKEKKKTEFDLLIEEYSTNEEVIQAIKDFIVMRKTVKKPMTTRALSNLLKKLDKLATNDQDKIQILDQSISNSWLGVFELKGDNYGNGVRTTKQDTGKGKKFNIKIDTECELSEEDRRAAADLL